MWKRQAAVSVVAGLLGAAIVHACVEGTPEAVTAEQAAHSFESVCTAALVVEATARHVQLPRGLEQLCRDPALPGRIVALLVTAEPSVQVIEAPDAGR